MTKEDWKQLAKTAWNKISLFALKAFRGLVCERKNGGWELSRSRTAFWIVFVHCMHVWNGGAKAAKELVSAATDVAVNTELTDTAATQVIKSGWFDSIASVVSNMSAGTGVPEQEFYLLMALIGYSAYKGTKDILSAARGK